MQLLSFPLSDAHYYQVRSSSSSKKSSEKTGGDGSSSVSSSNHNDACKGVLNDSNASLPGHTFFGVSFNPFDFHRDIFASVGGRKVVIFDTKEEDLEQQVLMLYEDEQKNENFYVCDWTVLMKQGRNPFLVLAVAGFTGVIKLLYPSCNDSKKGESSSDEDDKDRVSVLVGHGQDVNDLKFHKRKSHLLLSASKDYSVRLWDIAKGVCIAVFGGECGHRDEVLSLDIHYSGNYFMSSGMDSSVKIWYLDEAIEEIFDRNRTEKKRVDPIISSHYPVFSTGRIHGNYIDCARFLYPNLHSMTSEGFEDILVLSKSIHDCIFVWKPILTSGDQKTHHYHNHNDDDDVGRAEYQSIPDGPSSILFELKVPVCDIWYIRFCSSTLITSTATSIKETAKSTASSSSNSKSLKTLIYCGNRNGKVCIHSLDHDSLARGVDEVTGKELTLTSNPFGTLQLEPRKVLSNPLSRQVIRQVAVNRDHTMLVAACDDGKIFRWSL